MIQPIGPALASLGLGLPSSSSDRPGTQTPAASTPPDVSRPIGLGASAVQQLEQQPESSLDKALAKVNDDLQAWSTGIRFKMDKDAQRLVVSIVDTASGKVLRTIPSDAVLQVARMIIKLQGTGVDTQA